MKIYTKEEMLRRSLSFLSSLECELEEDPDEAKNLEIVRFLLKNLRKSQKVVCEANEIDEGLKKIYGLMSV